jgi:signal transduction histidine kinase
VGYAEFLDDEIAGPLTPQQHEFVEQLQKNSKRLAGMVNDLLDFARIEAGTFQLAPEQMDMAAKIREVAEGMAPQLESAGLRLELDLPDAPMTITADPDRMARVLANLLSNAIKFTPQGGLIRIRARLDGADFVGEVSDTGVGIAAEDIPKLFKRFVQLESGRKQKGGTGLGLSICKAIIEAHGGSIGVVSEPGKGSTFWFRIPIQGPPPPEA